MKLKLRFSALWGAALIATTQLARAEDLVIGVFLPTTGVWAPSGSDMRNGYELAAEGAKVKNLNVRLVVEDTTAVPSVALRKAQKLVLQDRARILIGGASSAEVLALGAQGTKLDVPVVTTNAAAIGITGEHCNRYVFRAALNDAMYSNSMRVLMQQRQDLAAKKWFVIYHDYVYGTSNKAAFAAIPGVKIVGDAGRPVGTADWASAIAKLQSTDATGVYLSMAANDDMATVINQLRSFGVTLPILTPGGMAETLLESVGKNGDGIITPGLPITWTLQDKSPEIAAFVKAYVAKHKKVPGFQAMGAYVGMQMTLASMNAAKDLSTGEIIKALEETTVNTLFGRSKFRKEDHQLQLGTYTAEAKMLPAPRHAATIAWHVVGEQKWESINYGAAEKGCAGL